MTQHLNRNQSAADRANHGVHRIPNRIHPWNFVGEKFEQIENTGYADDPWVAEDFERLILRRQRDAVEMDGESSGKNGEVKIDARQRSEAEGDGEEIDSFHREIYPRVNRLKQSQLHRLTFQRCNICNPFNFVQ